MASLYDSDGFTNDEVRDELLTKIRRVQASDKLDARRRQAVQDRLTNHPRNLIPKRGEGDTQHRVKLFSQMMIAANATVEEVRTPSDIPVAAANFLRDHNLPQRIRFGKDPALTGLAWSKTPSLDVSEGRARVHDDASMSRAFAAVAESGTVVMTSGQDNPTTLNFLPENHIVVVEAGRIHGNYEEVWDEIRKHYGEAMLPRTVNFISGPSRTGDIEQRLELGAHGPRRLHIIILNPEQS
ncbi:MAG: LutC/YkgG family protein [Hyphomicrobiales bacterium]